ncbi:helix-turn-helix domain-containing protein [Pilosibacter fragilis]|uniref:helix-turn-helix domain-containing protein n=1 Tax=Pilosibacter fragilis TaxID=3078042 RepID=UPI0001CE6808|nr:XRE family transcriptional regulator [Clostridiaceae bacterium TF01-6]CBL42514.1 Predicted transcriptional regulators [butyrate-producing bacterium SS3/4]
MDNRLYERRKELGLTLEDVGKIVGVTKSTVKKWESGYIENMRRDKIALLAKALNVSPLYIMGIDAGPDQVNDEDYINFQLESNTVEPEPDYYLNNETRKVAQEVYENPELRAFFHEPGKKLLVNYVQLSDVNKKKVISYSENLLKIQQMEEEQLHLIPDAAHDRTDVETTDDMKQNDDAIMENNSFWKK